MRNFYCLLLIVLFSGIATAQPLNPVTDSIPVRDGMKLAADIHVPDTSQSYPVILIQTPYNRVFYRWGLPLGVKTNLAASNYVFVVIDWRCFYGSQSACVAQPDRGKDGYDVVEWVAAQPWCNGKVGTWGPSALGKIQFQTAREKPPSLVCGVPLVAGSQFNYEEYYPGGVLRTEYVDQLDGLGFGLSPFLLANPVYNLTWQFVEASALYPQDIEVPMFMIGGWYDHNVEVMLELFDALRNSSPAAVRDDHRLLMGPWAHGGFGQAQVGSEQQGELIFPEAAGWSDSLALVFFDYWLRNVNNGWDATPFMKYMQMGENVWESVTAWPPATTDVTFYMHADGSLSETMPAGTTDSGTITYDPTDPSPTVGGPTLRQDQVQGPYDQAPAVESRNGILTFTTPVLTQDAKLKGQPVVNLYVSSDRTDTDFAIRLTDVYPDGRSMLLSDNILRMRFRNGFTANDTSNIIPGQLYAISIPLPNTANTFLAGHRIRVDVTSSNYPRFDSNLNNGGPMYTAGDSLVATNTLYLNSANASHIVLPLAGYATGTGNAVTGTQQIRVYPNPATGRFDLTFTNERAGNVKAELLSMDGKLVKALVNTYAGEGLFRNTVRTGDLPPGIYVVRVSANGTVHNSRVAITP